MTTMQYDVLIIGSGMVGLTLACALGDSSLKVAVLDRQTPVSLANGHPKNISMTRACPQFAELRTRPNLRVSAITLASQKIFSHLNVWSLMQSHCVSPFRKIKVWDINSSNSIEFDSATIGGPTLGYIIENAVMQAALFQQMQTYKNIDFIAPAELKTFTKQDNSILIELNDGKKLQTQLLVGADGARSKVRELADISLTAWNYDHTAIVATVETELSHEETAWQYFLPDGVLAFLPLNEKNKSSIVWSTTPAYAEQLCAMEEKNFQQTLAQTFSYRLGDILKTSKCLSFPLRMQHAQKYCLPNIALIGDAAHTIHPLAGQGVNLGLLDAAALAEIILKNPSNIGCFTTLRRYERWRKGDNLLMLTMVEGLKKIFNTENKLVAQLRGAGLNFTNNFLPLKNFFMRQAAGLKGDLPALAK